MTAVVVQANDFPYLLTALQEAGYRTLGPKRNQEAIVYGEITAVQEMPIGWTDKQGKGHYSLTQSKHPTLFRYNVGPQSWKAFLYPPHVRLWKARQTTQGLQFLAEKTEPERLALIGVRGCELQAISIQDQIFLTEPYTDPLYRSHRNELFMVAINCSQAAKTCFCTSMQTGPQVKEGFDLAMTEIYSDQHHILFTVIGSDKGKDMLKAVPHVPASLADRQEATCVLENTALQMEKHLDITHIREDLYQNLQHPAWDDMAQTCLACGNCTVVCPTCFCTTVEDTSDLTGEHSERWRRWDSCFTTEFSTLHGGPIRQSITARYRQWLTHKLAGWIDQFGRSGCVGCGRCIVWCPVGIDLTESVAAIRLPILKEERN